jgi:hypothetical protein
MEAVLLITACKPWLPTSAAEALGLRSPPSVTAADQAESPPDSNPSAKIRSAADGGVDVLVAVAVAVLVAVLVRVAVRVGVEVDEGMAVEV